MNNTKITQKLEKKYHKMPYVSDLKDLLYKSANKYANRIFCRFISRYQPARLLHFVFRLYPKTLLSFLPVSA